MWLIRRSQGSYPSSAPTGCFSHALNSHLLSCGNKYELPHNSSGSQNPAQAHLRKGLDQSKMTMLSIYYLQTSKENFKPTTLETFVE